ncbi:acyl carrier protein [Gracilibacillus lacisalsi]|uniref:acyl carrier protein n=1 Tax=Gracilibacillus lacisalsi TaxID=393087 RepID=UPI0003795EAC|nr:acyl carrier protein [Gracilibacillus lacisalsi]
MTYSEFKKYLSEVCHVPIEDITDDVSFRNDLGIDSLQMVNVIVGLRDKTEISLTNITDSESFATPKKLYQTIIGG